MNFITMRDRTLASVLGHVIAFKKGVPTYVPPEIYDEAIGIGAVPEDELPQPDEKDKSNEPEDAAARRAALFAAFTAMTLRNKREEFTAGGAPAGDALNKELGWKVESKERVAAWAQFRELKGTPE